MRVNTYRDCPTVRPKNVMASAINGQPLLKHNGLRGPVLQGATPLLCIAQATVCNHASFTLIPGTALHLHSNIICK